MDIEIIPTHDYIINSPQEAAFKRGTIGSAGIDLIACIEHKLTLYQNESRLINAGFKLYIKSPNIVGFILPRSGKGSKGLVIGNLTGVIDSDYQGDLKICLWNRSESPIQIFPGEAVAQLIFLPVYHPTLKVVEAFSTNTIRGEGGFGSTSI